MEKIVVIIIIGIFCKILELTFWDTEMVNDYLLQIRPRIGKAFGNQEYKFWPNIIYTFITDGWKNFKKYLFLSVSDE